MSSVRDFTERTKICFRSGLPVVAALVLWDSNARVNGEIFMKLGLAPTTEMILNPFFLIISVLIKTHPVWIKSAAWFFETFADRASFFLYLKSFE